MAVVTGAEFVTEDTGRKLEDVDVNSLGSAKSVRVTKDATTILDGIGTKAEVDERAELIREQIDKTTSTYEKDKLKERLASLAGGVAVIKVGGASEFEVSEIKDRLNDALCATKAAVEEGIVPGGGRLVGVEDSTELTTGTLGLGVTHVGGVDDHAHLLVHTTVHTDLGLTVTHDLTRHDGDLTLKAGLGGLDLGGQGHDLGVHLLASEGHGAGGGGTHGTDVLHSLGETHVSEGGTLSDL